MRINNLAVCAGLAVLLGGCATMTPAGKTEATTFGEAKNMTMAAQIIDPDPQYEFLDPVTSGLHAAQAAERYRTDKVKRPERISSTISSSGAK